MKIEILGTGCMKCQQLASNAEQAAKKLGIDYELCKVTDLREIVQRGVLATPALVVDGQVKISGKLATSDEIGAMFSE